MSWKASRQAGWDNPLRTPGALRPLCARPQSLPILHPRYAHTPIPYRGFTPPQPMFPPDKLREHRMLSDIIFICGGLAVFALAGLAVRSADRL